MGCIGALVAGFGAAAFDGLFDVVGGDHAVGYGRAGFHAQLREGFGNFVVDITGVGSGALDDYAHGDDGIIFAGIKHFFDREGDFIRTGHPCQFNIIRTAAVTDDRVDRTFHQMSNKKVIEAGRHQTEFQTIGLQVAFESFDVLQHN